LNDGNHEEIELVPIIITLKLFETFY